MLVVCSGLPQERTTSNHASHNSNVAVTKNDVMTICRLRHPNHADAANDNMSLASNPTQARRQS
jgi:hypothetical protein